MSAFLLPKAHYDALVQAAVQYGLCRLDDADDLGRTLVRETYVSLAARYGDPIPETIDYRFEGVEAPLDPYVLVAAARSYRYQSCEHRGYVDSDAETLVDLLLTALAVDLRENYDEPTAGWGDFIGDAETGWVIDDLNEAVAR
jgi:hypothetical protein